MREWALSRLMSSFILRKGAMVMTRTLQEQLVEKGLSKNLLKKAKRRLKNNDSKMSRKDIEELMGIRRPTYKRNKGAIRQK